jgi:hypothetical protein
MAAATRNGRTMLAVVLQSPDIYRSASALLDLGFATPVARESRVDHLPAVSTSAPAPTATTEPVTHRATGGLVGAPAHGAGFFGGLLRDIVLGVAATVLVLATVVVVLRRRAVRRRRTRLGPLATRRY